VEEIGWLLAQHESEGIDMENDKKKIPDAIQIGDDLKTSEIARTEQERARNTDLWRKNRETEADHARIMEATPAKAVDDHGRDERKISVREKATVESSSVTTIHEMMDKAWDKRFEPARFDTQGKTAVLYSGESTASDFRRELLGKNAASVIHSGELAAQHAASNSDTHIKLEQTPGGQELEGIQKRVNSDAISSVDRERLQQRLNVLWADASRRFSESARENPASLAYVEHAKENGVYRDTERPCIDAAKQHRHLTDVPNVDGRPPKEDKLLPGDLDKDGRYYTA
jgi:hypothetical protein